MYRIMKAILEECTRRDAFIINIIMCPISKAVEKFYSLSAGLWTYPSIWRRHVHASPSNAHFPGPLCGKTLQKSCRGSLSPLHLLPFSPEVTLIRF